jgi:hypothetical protein
LKFVQIIALGDWVGHNTKVPKVPKIDLFLKFPTTHMLEKLNAW